MDMIKVVKGSWIEIFANLQGIDLISQNWVIIIIIINKASWQSYDRTKNL